MDAFEFFVKEEPVIRAMCANLAGTDFWLRDDLYTEAALRITRICEMHSARSKILRILKWYLWKYRNAAVRSQLSELPELPCNDHFANVVLRDEVYKLLSVLCVYEQNIVMWRVQGYTLTEIADHLHIAKSTVRNKYIAAIEKIQQYASLQR